MIFVGGIRQAHRVLAIGLAVFIVMHFSVHLTALGGPQMHNQSLKAVQWIYRNPIVEPFLILAILTQVITGVGMLVRKWRMPNKGFWAWAQIVSGLGLAWPIIQHSSAALISRHFIGIDTNFFWVAGPLQNATLRGVFVPYYFVLVFGVFVHLAAFAYFRRKRDTKVAVAIVALGALISTTIVATFVGVFFPISIPSEYTQVYDSFARGEWPSPAKAH
jgi:hypothetical protein